MQTWSSWHNPQNRGGQGTGLLFVGGLPLHACDQNLTRHFRKFGPLDLAAVQRFPNGRSKGYAFIQFVRPADALKVFQTEHSILGKSLSVRFAQGESLKQSGLEWNPRSTRRILIYNIPRDFERRQIIGELSRFVQVEHLSVLKPHHGGKSCYVVPKQIQDAHRLLKLGEIVTDDGFRLKFRAPNSTTIPSKVNKVTEKKQMFMFRKRPKLAEKEEDEANLAAREQLGYSEDSSNKHSYRRDRSPSERQETNKSLIKLRKGLWIVTPSTEFSSDSEDNYRFRLVGQSNCDAKISRFYPSNLGLQQYQQESL